MSGAAIDYIPSVGDRVAIVRSGNRIASGAVITSRDDDHGNSFSRLTFTVTVRITESAHRKLAVDELVRFDTKEGGLFGWWHGHRKGKIGSVRIQLERDKP